MNPNLTEVSKSTQWKLGQSGNLNGRPPGTRQLFSAAFFADLGEVWAAHGKEAMLHTAKTQPATFLGLASKLIPQQVAVDLQASLPAGLSLDDWATLREVLSAVREGLPGADQMAPGQVFQHVLAALRNCAEMVGRRDESQGLPRQAPGAAIQPQRAMGVVRY